MSTKLVLGSAVTGAKFTPLNHATTGSPKIDAISRGETIRSNIDELEAEQAALYAAGCRYYHYHARNPETHEQATDNSIYQQVSLRAQRTAPQMLLSFGASRNGQEVRASIAQYGEWERVSQAALPLHLGGAHFVTKQAAVELQILLDMQRQGFDISLDAARHQQFHDAVLEYRPTAEVIDATLQTFSSTNGNNYGSTSAATQLETFACAVQARTRLHLLHEVEWVQLERSYAMTRFATEHPDIQLGGNGQLNITLLFGFSPAFPFPQTYSEFRSAVQMAREFEYDLRGRHVRNVTISVGAAVIPQHAQRHIRPVDVGPWRGTNHSAATRLAIWAAQPDSGVDILRTGMEDTPYWVDDNDELTICDNLRLLTFSRAVLERHDAEVIEDGGEARTRLGLTHATTTLNRQHTRHWNSSDPVQSWPDRSTAVA